MTERHIGFSLGAGVTILVLVLYGLGSFEWLELRLYDLRFTLIRPQMPSTPILLVRIDDDTERHLNVRASQISRALYATAVRRLVQGGAKVVAFDVVFARPQQAEDDAAFVGAVAEAGNVILARYIGDRGHTVPFAALREAELSEALINIDLDADGVLRGIPLLGFDYTSGEAEPVLALALEVARFAESDAGSADLDLEHAGELRLGPLHIPYPDGRMRINFYGPPGTFPRLSFWEAVEGRFDADAVRDKLVLIGSATPSLHDDYQTPYTDKLVVALTGETQRAHGLRMDGFEIHAHAIQTILDRRFIVRAGDHPWLVPGIIVVLGVLGTAWLLYTHGSVSRLLAGWLTAIVLILGGGWLAFAVHRYWLDTVPLLALAVVQIGASMAFQRHVERRKRREVVAIFGRYVAPQVVNRLVHDPALANPSGRKERLTIFFSDVRGFTALSEKMEPQMVQTLLSEYFTEMTKILFAHRGTLDKFMGDAVMAFFGNPEPQRDHAARAVRAGLEMQAAIARLNAQWAAQGRPTIGVGMGINTGEVTVGNLGSKDFMDYTVIGDAVNVACRLEQYAGPGDVIISDATYQEVRDQVDVEPRDPIRVKGKSELVGIYRVTAWHPPKSETIG